MLTPSARIAPLLRLSPGESRSRLLLRDTVNGTQAPDQRLTREANDLATWKDLLQNRQGTLVVRMVVGGYQHHPIGNIKVGVAGWQACRWWSDRARHGECYDL